MIIGKTSDRMFGVDNKKQVLEYIRNVDADLKNIFLAFSNRIRFGDGSDGEDGENISGQFQVFTSSATPDAENTISHNLGAAPIGYMVINKDKAAHLYDSGTAWTSTNIYLKSDVATTEFKIFLIK